MLVTQCGFAARKPTKQQSRSRAHAAASVRQSPRRVSSLRLVLLHGRVHLLLALRLHDAVLLVARGGGGLRRGAARVLVLVRVVALGGIALRVPIAHALAVAVRVLLLRRLCLWRRQS